jgi:hypothetical protein
MEMASNARAWRRRIQNGTDVLRVEAAMYAEHLDQAIEAGMRTGDVAVRRKHIPREVREAVSHPTTRRRGSQRRTLQ